MATVTDFTIIKGQALDFDIIVKQAGTTLPEILDPTDTFTFSLVEKKTNTKVIDSQAMTIVDVNNGQVRGTISAISSAALTRLRSKSEDGYISRPNYRLIVHGITVSQGEITASIEDVYVEIG